MDLRIVHVTDAVVVRDRTVRLTFDDGTTGEADLAPLLRGPLFTDIAVDDAAFHTMFVDHQAGTIAWPNNADLAPETLHALVRGEPDALDFGEPDHDGSPVTGPSS